MNQNPQPLIKSIILQIGTTGIANGKHFACEGTLTTFKEEGNMTYEINVRFYIPNIPTLVHLRVQQPLVTTYSKSNNNSFPSYIFKELTRCQDLQKGNFVNVEYKITSSDDLESITNISMYAINIENYIATTLQKSAMTSTLTKLMWLVKMLIILRLISKKIWYK